MDTSTRQTTMHHLVEGESVTKTITAASFWNDTGIRLIAGQEYHFTATGEWIDWYIPCNADGFASPSPFFWPFEWVRRAPGARWFALIGAIDHDPFTHFLIGANRTMVITLSGELTCFANDNAFAYWNNRGSIELTITRTR